MSLRGAQRRGNLIAISIQSVCFILSIVLVPAGGGTFLSLNKKVPKELSQRGVAERSESKMVACRGQAHNRKSLRANDPVAVPCVRLGANACVAHRPLPLTQLPSSATGGGRIAPPPLVSPRRPTEDNQSAKILALWFCGVTPRFVTQTVC